MESVDWSEDNDCLFKAHFRTCCLAVKSQFVKNLFPMVHDDSSTQQIVVGECLLYLLANVEMLMNLHQDLN